MHGASWAVKYHCHRPLGQFLVKHDAVFEELSALCGSQTGWSARYQLNRHVHHALPIPGWENLEQSLAEHSTRSVPKIDARKQPQADPPLFDGQDGLPGSHAPTCDDGGKSHPPVVDKRKQGPPLPLVEASQQQLKQESMPLVKLASDPIPFGKSKCAGNTSVSTSRTTTSRTLR